MSERILNTVNELRVARGITQAELADTLSVSRQTIIAIEKGNYAPSIALALKIGAYFNKPVEKIFTIA